MSQMNEEIEDDKRLLKQAIVIVIILSLLTIFQALVMYQYMMVGILNFKLAGVTLMFLGLLTTTISSALICSSDYKIIKLKEKINQL